MCSITFRIHASDDKKVDRVSFSLALFLSVCVNALFSWNIYTFLPPVCRHSIHKFNLFYFLSTKFFTAKEKSAIGFVHRMSVMMISLYILNVEINRMPIMTLRMWIRLCECKRERTKRQWLFVTYAFCDCVFNNENESPRRDGIDGVEYTRAHLQ